MCSERVDTHSSSNGDLLKFQHLYISFISGKIIHSLIIATITIFFSLRYIFKIVIPTMEAEIILNLLKVFHWIVLLLNN